MPTTTARGPNDVTGWPREMDTGISAHTWLSLVLCCPYFSLEFADPNFYIFMENSKFVVQILLPREDFSPEISLLTCAT